MKAFVTEDTCTGCGLCSETCPEVFELDGDIAKVIADEVPAEAEGKCVEASKECPVEAITVEE